MIQQKATKDDCVYWVSRLLAHFPRRDVQKDAIVLSDIAADLLEKEVTEAAICETCRNLRLASTSENPFMPPSGEIVESAKSWTSCFKTLHERLKNV